MKKQFFIVLVLVITVLVLSGCGDIDPVRENQPGQAQGASVTVTSVPTTEPSISEQPTVTITVTIEPTPTPGSRHFVENDEYYEANAVLDDTKQLTIPVYEDEDLLHAFGVAGFRPGTNLSWDAMMKSESCAKAWAIRKYFPNPAIRKRADGLYYWVYDSNKGRRLFLFFHERFYRIVAIGYPVVIQSGTPLKKYADFASIQPGSTLRDVENIDSIVEVYRREFYGADGQWINKMTSTNRDRATVHYLSDGLLVIHYYDINEENELLVSSIEYYDDYCMPAGLTKFYQNMEELIIDYRLNPLDLPSVE